MRVQVIGESESAVIVRGYLKQAGDVIVWKDGDRSNPDYVVTLEERHAKEVYFESIQCDLEMAIMRHIRQKTHLPLVLCAPKGVRSDQTIRIVFPPSESQAVELGVQMGFADLAESQDKAAAALTVPVLQPGSLKRLEEALERFADKVDTLESQVEEMRKPAPVPWWRSWWKYLGWTTTLVIFLFSSSASAQDRGVSVQGIHNTVTPTLGNIQYAPLQLDGSGNLLINCTTGCSASSGPSFGSPFPATGNAVGFIGSTGNLTGGTLDASGNLKIDCALGCSGAADTTATGNLTAGGSTVSIAMAGVNSASFTLAAGNNLSAILTPEASADGGTTWTATFLRNANAGFWAATVTVSSTAGAFNILVPGGASNIRIRVSTYTSGAANSTVVRGVSQPEAVAIPNGIPASAAPPYAVQVGGTDGANLRALSTDSSGHAIVEPGNTANTTPWLSTINQGGNSATVTAGNALKVDGSAVTQPVSGTVTANAGSGTFNIQGNASVNLNQVAGSALGAITTYGTSPGAVNVESVNAFVTNTVATTASINSGSNTIGKVDILGNAGATLDSAPAATAPTNVLQVGGTFTTTPTTLSSGQAGALELDSAQNLLVNLKTAIPAGANNIGSVNQGTNPWTDQGALGNNGSAATTNRVGSLPGVAQTSYNNGTASTQGRDVAQNIGTDGLLWTAALPSMRPASYTASSKFAASSTTDNSCMPGNATNTVLVTELRVSGIQTTAGILNAEIIKRSAADSAGTPANMTAVPDDSNYAAASSQPVSFTGTGPSVGAAVGDIDNAEIGFMATGTASPNDIYIANWRQKPIVLRGTAQEICVNMGNAAVTGGTMTVTYKWIETTTITP